MNEWTSIIVGGGNAGLGALKAIRQETWGMVNGKRIPIDMESVSSHLNVHIFI